MEAPFKTNSKASFLPSSRADVAVHTPSAAGFSCLISPAVCVRPRERLPSFRQHSAAVPLRLVQMLLLFRRSVASDSLRPRGLQPARPPCPSRSSLKLVSIESVMPSNHLILCRPLLLLPSIFPSIRIFSNESSLHIRWSKLPDQRPKVTIRIPLLFWMMGSAGWHEVGF